MINLQFGLLSNCVPVSAQRRREPLWTEPLLLTNSTKQNKKNRQHKVTHNSPILVSTWHRLWVMMKWEEETKGTVNWRVCVWILMNMMELSLSAFGFISSNQLHSLPPFFIRSITHFSLSLIFTISFSVFIISLLIRITVSLGLSFFFFVNPPVSREWRPLIK